MIRAAIYLYLLIVGAAIALYLAGGQGDVLITWHGYRIETTAWALIVAAAVIAAPLVLLCSVMGALLRALTSIGKSPR